MTIEVRVQSFSGRYGGRNGNYQPTVAVPEVINKAITVGGFVAGSPRQRSFRRSAIANIVLSSVRAGPDPAGDLAVTSLYERTETTEKTGISFRLGMAFAAVACGRTLGITKLMHVAFRSGGAGRRADLVGLDASRNRHVVEAKARSYGFPRSLVSYAKSQAATTDAAYRAGGTQIETASAVVADFSCNPIYVLVEDPDPQGKEVEPRDFDEHGFLMEYYSAVRELLEVRPEEPSGNTEVDERAIGAWLPGSVVWLGLARRHFAAAAGFSGAQDEQRNDESERAAVDSAYVSATPDGHFVVLNPEAVDYSEPESAQ